MDRAIDESTVRLRRLRRVATVVATVVVAASVFVVASDWLRPSLKRSRTRFGVVQRGDLEATLLASGTVVPASERVVSCPIDARIERVLHRAGDLVEAGTEILELDTSTTRLEISRLDQQLSQIRNDRLQRRLELEEQLADLASRVATGGLDLDIARFRLDQTRQLWGAGLVTAEALKEAEVVVRKAEIELARLNEEIVVQRRLNDARLERLGLDAGILTSNRDDVRRQLELATTRAPVTGVLTEVVDEEGATATRGQILARIANLESFRVEARVSDAYAQRLSVGQDAHVVIDDRRLEARVASILPTVDAGTVGFSVALEDPSSELLRHNLRVDVLVVTGRRDNVLKAPRGSYIQGGGDRHRVFVVAGDEAHRTEVTLGLVGHDSLEIVEGLSEGDEIILSDVRDYMHAEQLRIK